MSSTKVANLMEVPPVALCGGLLSTVNKDIYYPSSLLDLWIKSTQPPHDSPSGLYNLSLFFLFVKLLMLDVERVKQKVTNISVLCSWDFSRPSSRTIIYITSRSTK
jgi:hypothetical protein